jgi:hypothetical protein
MRLALIAFMNDVLQTLLKLQTYQFDETAEKVTEAQTAELRSKVPQPILAHYDRLAVRGKKGVAVVRNQVCTGCHMRLPIGTINTLMQGTDIQLCDSCGRYLYLPTPAESEFVEHMAAVKPEGKAKPAPKARKRKALAPTA